MGQWLRSGVYRLLVFKVKSGNKAKEEEEEGGGEQDEEGIEKRRKGKDIGRSRINHGAMNMMQRNNGKDRTKDEKEKVKHIYSRIDISERQFPSIQTKSHDAQMRHIAKLPVRYARYCIRALM